jgi:hypothetical protein
MLPFIATGIAIGALSEGAAYYQRLWVYRNLTYPIVNVLVVFGLVMGGLASRGAAWGLGAVYAAGAAVGLAYEWLNLALLGWWSFPGERLLVFRGHAAIVTALGWGVVPVAIALVAGPARL